MSDSVPREFVTLWVSESLARQRMNLEALSHFVAAVTREIHQRVDDTCDDGELDVACALLPNGRLLVDVQVQPQQATPAWLAPLEKRLAELPLPPVRRLPVAFSFRTSLGRGIAAGEHAFRIPFVRWAADWSGGSIDQLILSAATRLGIWEGERSVELPADEGTGATAAERVAGVTIDAPHAAQADSTAADRGAATAPVQPGRGRLRRWWHALRGWWERSARALGRPRGGRLPAAAATTETLASLENADAGDAEESLTLDQLNERILAAPDDPTWYRRRAERRREEGDLSGALADYSTVLQLDPSDIEARLARGAAACVQGDTQAGLHDFNTLLARDPGHVAARYNRGILMLDLDAYEAAVTDFSAAIDCDPWSPRLWIARGRAHALQRNFEQAWQDFSAAIRLDPHDDEAYALRAACTRFTLPFPEGAQRAMEDYTQAIQIAPDRPLYFVQRAEHAWACDDFDAALVDCDAALQLDPEFDAAYGLRGAVFLALDQPERAIEDCTRTIDRGTATPGVYLTRAEAYLAQGDWEEAFADADIAVEQAPDQAAAWKCRSLVRLRLGQSDEALADLNEALRLSPEQASLWCHRAALYRHQGQAERGLQDCRRALELSPDFAPALLIRAGCWEDCQDREQAAADLDRLVDLSPDDVQSRMERANFWMRGDDYDRARSDLDAVLVLEPDNLSARFHRGQILAAQGEVEAALADLTHAITVSPEFAPAYTRRANVWLLKGFPERATEDYQRAETLDPDSAEQFQLMRLVDEAHWHLTAGRVTEALARADEALLQAPDHPPALHVRALSLLAAEELVEALAALEKLRELIEETPALAVFQGQLLEELGEYEAACAAFDQALAGMSTAEPAAQRGAALAGRGFARAGLGDEAGANQDFDAAVPLTPLSAWLFYQLGRVYHQRGLKADAACCFRLALRLERPGLTPRQRQRAQAYVQSQGNAEG
ncbi:MAG: tetratricopeptide repeat protein [Pirellulales bacterium]